MSEIARVDYESGNDWGVEPDDLEFDEVVKVPAGIYTQPLHEAIWPDDSPPTKELVIEIDDNGYCIRSEVRKIAS